MLSSTDYLYNYEPHIEEQYSKKLVYGNFPVYHSKQSRFIFILNSTLSAVLIGLILSSMVCYSFVVSKQKYINTLQSDTRRLNIENNDLQNKVDYLKSFYNVDSKITYYDYLVKPKQVLEVKGSSESDVLVEAAPSGLKINSMIGY